MEQVLCVVLFCLVSAALASIVTWAIMDHKETKSRQAEPYPRPLGLISSSSELPVGTYQVCAMIGVVENVETHQRYPLDSWALPEAGGKLLVGEHTGKHSVHTHYDEPVIGRFDGENWNIGFYDVCGRPYEPLVAAARITHERLYDIATGHLPPYNDLPEYLPLLFC